MKYIVKSFSPLYNYCIEEYSKNCGYCDILKREFVTHSSDKFCEWRLTISMSVFRKHGYKKDINDGLKRYFNGKKCNKYWKIYMARE